MSDLRDIFSVSRLNSELRAVVEGSFPLLWVRGEISNLSMPRSGHLYFSLKDAQAQIRCALFRNKRNLLRHLPKDGEEVVVRAKLAVYEPRGDCQLIIEHLEPAGAGDLQQAFNALKKKLDAEGLFEQARKLALPATPTSIGIITSPSGAALRDVLQVLGRRHPGAHVLIYPSLVQGDSAAQELTAAVQLACTRREVDVLILARGGGATEDLAAFNDEQLARAIANCPIPLVSAVGHEIDFSIADFVADRRAPTPSAAAELVSPDSSILSQRFDQTEHRLRSALTHKLTEARQGWLLQDARLARQHPGLALARQQQRLDQLSARLHQATLETLTLRKARLQAAAQALASRDPRQQLARWHERISGLHSRLQQVIAHRIKQQQQRLQSTVGKLNAISPLATLQRGYSIALSAKGQAIRDSRQTQTGDKLSLKLARGELNVTVDKTSDVS